MFLYKIFKNATNLMFILVLALVSWMVLMISIFIVFNYGTFAPETETAFNLFGYIMLFVFSSKVVLQVYETYKEN